LDTGTWGYLALYGGIFLLDTGTWGYLALYVVPFCWIQGPGVI